MGRATEARILKEELASLLEERARRHKYERLKYYNKIRQHRKQLEFHNDKHRNRWLFGGNRTGKTVAGAVEAVWMARGNHPHKKIKKPTKGWVVSLDYNVQRDVAQKEILKWLNPDWIIDIHVRAGKKDDPENAIIDFILVQSEHGGTSVIGFKSCDQGRAKFQGTSQDWIWFDEEPPQDIYDECKMRIIDTRGDIWGTMTPLQGLTWVYDKIYINDVKDPEVRYWLMEWADNPWLSREELDWLESTMTEDEREARQYGRFVAMSGLIYKEFREDIHVIDPFDVPREWYNNISIDPGLDAPLSCHFYAVDYDGNIYVVAEHYMAGESVEYHAKQIHRLADELLWPKDDGYLFSLIDSAANAKTLAAEKTVTELFIENMIYCNTNVKKDVWSGIQRVKSYLKLRPHSQEEAWPQGKPKLFIFKTCPMMIKEIKSYRWKPQPEKSTSDEPIKKNDHAMDELRYFIMSRPEINELDSFLAGGPDGKPGKKDQDFDREDDEDDEGSEDGYW